MKISLPKKIILLVVMASILFTLAPAADAFGVPDIFFLALKAKQYYDFWRGIRGELDSINAAANEEILTADKTQNPDGEPAFIEYWRDFIGESQFRGENVFRVQLANTSVCDYLKESIQSIYGVSDFEYDGRRGLPAGFDTKAAEVRVHPYELEARCTLATIEGSDSNDGAGTRANQDQFLDDWIQSADPLGSYLELSKTQNNFYGAYLLADKEFKNQASFEKEKDVYEALANGGYKGARDTGDADQEGCIKDSQGRCVVLGKVSTPGGILSEAGAKVYTSEWDIITNRNEGTIQSILGSLIDKFLNFNTGTGIEGDDNTLSIAGIIPSQATDVYNVDFRDARNHQACIRECDEQWPPRKPEGCAETPQVCTQCLEYAGFSVGGSDGGTDRECRLWANVACEGAEDRSRCEIEDDSYGQRAGCYEDCGNKYLFPDPPNAAGGRCGVNYPSPQCTCEAIDGSASYDHASTVIGIQQGLVSSCASIGILCGDNGPHGLGKLDGGISNTRPYMDALVAAINASGLTATYHFVGVEPILGVSDGEKTEYYDVITSSGNVWNNDGKVICETGYDPATGPTASPAN